jgi:hypothetical protein
MTFEVSDKLSNRNENIEAAAKVLGRSKQRIKVFDKIYFGKKLVKTVDELSVMTGLTNKQVLTQGKKLADNHLVIQTKVETKTAYKKIPFFHENKKEIISLVSNKEKLKNYPTKRKAAKNEIVNNVQISIPNSHFNIKQITIDDLDSFSKVKEVSESGHLSKEYSEADFKNGVISIIGEAGDFKDWGGEKNDLYTTRIKIAGNRIPVAFAFKGPGTKGKLVPGKLGKNGDQIQRLFEADAEVFFVQYHDQIEQSVIEQMKAMAIMNSVKESKEIMYGIIDGVDSKRIVMAYSEKFSKSKK